MNYRFKSIANQREEYLDIIFNILCDLKIAKNPFWVDAGGINANGAWTFGPSSNYCNSQLTIGPSTHNFTGQTNRGPTGKPRQVTNLNKKRKGSR